MFQDVREDLRCSMANDLTAIQNESFKTIEDHNLMGISSDINEEKPTSKLLVPTSLDFQKKVTFSKHEKKDTESSSYLGSKEAYKFLNGTIYYFYVSTCFLTSLLEKLYDLKLNKSYDTALNNSLYTF